MNQVGIGQLQHAKPSKQVPVKTRLNRREHKRILQDAELSDKQEGQLSVDILQSDQEMFIICPIAGVNKEDLSVAIQDDVLTIRGERKPVTDLDSKQSLVRELFWGNFSRSIVLPDHIDRSGIEAKVHEHLLIITIPKTEDFKTRIIHVSED